MNRDHRKLKVFEHADALVLQVYRLTADLPAVERFGLQAQIRRAAISIPTNIVEGSTRPSTTDYCRFLIIASGSANETAYLLGLSSRLGFLEAAAVRALAEEYERIAATLVSAVRTLQSKPT